jgi:hypothetical protein
VGTVGRLRGHERSRSSGKLAGHEISDVSDAGWAWSIATDTGPIRLPGEGAGGPGDPFTEQLDPDVARRLRE